MARVKLFVAPLVALAAVLSVASHQAQAQVKSFKINGVTIGSKGIPVVPGTTAPHTSVGHATELGNHTGTGNFILLGFPDPVNDPLTATFSSFGPFVFTAANGDNFACTYGDTNNGAKQSGVVTLTVVGLTPNNTPIVTARFVAEFNPFLAQCTGRFSRLVGGSFIMIAQSEPFVLGATDPVRIAWSGDGWVQYGK